MAEKNPSNWFGTSDKINITVSIAEGEHGKGYSGIFSFPNGIKLNFHLRFEMTIHEILFYLSSDPMKVLKGVEFLIHKGHDVSEVFEVDKPTYFEMLGIAMGGAKAISEGNIINHMGLKMAFSETTLHRTPSIEPLLMVVPD